MKKLAVYDLEIKNNIEDIPGGWNNHAAMGISCLGLYDYEEDFYKIFDDHTKMDFLHDYFLNGDVMLISFNGLKFDDNVVIKNWLIPTEPPITRKAAEFDILDAVWKSLGKKDFHKGVGLDALCKATLHSGKSGSGAFAPQLFKEGRIGELVTYCMRDVWLTKKLFEFIRIHGFVVSPTYGEITVEIPYDNPIRTGQVHS